MPMPPRSLYEKEKIKKETYKENECLRGIGMGLLLGLCVGTTLGSGYVALLYYPRGLRGIQLYKTMGKVALKMGLTFGSFMSIGGALRCEEDEKLINNNNNNNSNSNKTLSILEFNNSINHSSSFSKIFV